MEADARMEDVRSASGGRVAFSTRFRKRMVGLRAGSDVAGCGGRSPPRESCRRDVVPPMFAGKFPRARFGVRGLGRRARRLFE